MPRARARPPGSRATSLQLRAHLREVGRRLQREVHLTARPRVHEAELACMQHRPRRLDARLAIVADVHALAEQRVARFAQVNADLVLAPGLERALHQARLCALFALPEPL